MSTALACTLTGDQLIALLRENEGKLRALGIISMAMFGSRARGDNRPDSDLDLLVDYARDRTFSLLDLAHAQNFTEDLAGCAVQMTTHDGLRESSLQAIEAQSINIY